MTAALRVVSPGLMTTLQDLGRPGYQNLGIPVSGALDPVSLRAANALAGNPPGSAALEIAYQGPTLAVEADSVRLAYAGAAAGIEVLSGDEEAGTRRLAPLQSMRLRRGQVVRIGALNGGAVAYLAVEGGFAVAPVLGSRSTYVRAGIGGIEGRALKAGDLVPMAQVYAEDREEMMLPSLPLTAPSRFRIVLGPQDDYFTPRGIETLLEATYTVTPASDRMGMRLDGPALEHAKGFNIVSDGIAPGSIQVPGNGLPIVLLADRQTTGGYPKVATVISADLPALGRLTPGCKVAFTAIGIEAAEAARRQMMADLEDLTRQLAPVRHESAIDAARLMASNLVSGVVNAREGNPEGA
ncbi:MAG: biotin-dependent carboxyltransferase family protein [Hyphomicrobiaceae bacterium]|nr:MAG: biotin-dependent carboxyltransferase family protein [Hyphomicrobiaceae bacterium]